MKKILLCLVLLLIFASLVQAVEVEKHFIEIKLDEEGFAHIIEEYHLKFEHGFELEEFATTTEKNSSSLQAWRIEYDWFYPRFSKTEDLQRAYVLFEEKKKVLTLDYFLKKQFATKAKETAREVEWKISDVQLKEFLKSGLIVIPENVELSIAMPRNAIIAKEQLSSQANVLEDKVILSGIRTNYVNLKYKILKPIATGDLFESIEKNSLIIGLVVLVIAGLVYWKKDKIAKKIEDYVVEHSEIKTSDSEEEIELDVEA